MYYFAPAKPNILNTVWLQEVELLKAQLQSQTAEITQLQSERQELLRGSETTVSVFHSLIIAQTLQSSALLSQP